MVIKEDIVEKVSALRQHYQMSAAWENSALEDADSMKETAVIAFKSKDYEGALEMIDIVSRRVRIEAMMEKYGELPDLLLLVGKSPCMAKYKSWTSSRDNQTSLVHNHLDHSSLCLISSLLSLSSSLSRCFCLYAVLLSTTFESRPDCLTLTRSRMGTRRRRRRRRSTRIWSAAR